MLLSAIQPFTLIDFPNHTACTVFTLGCNFRCHYCYNSEFVLPEKIKNILPDCIPEKNFFAFLKNRNNLLEGVCITGGEPTIHNDLPKFLKKIKSKGLLVKLDTNGSNPDMLQKIIDQNLVDYIAMDIKTHPDEYEKIIGVSGFSEKIKQSKKILEQSKIQYEFRTVIIPNFHTKNRKKKLFNFVGKSNFHRLTEFTPKNGCLNPKWKE